MRQKLLFCFLFVGLVASLFAEKYYWESPTRWNVKNTHFLHSASMGNTSLALWQEVIPQGGRSGIVYASMAICSNGSWYTNERITPAIPYSVTIPSVASATIGKDGSIIMVSINQKDRLAIYNSVDAGRTFNEFFIDLPSNDFSSPYIITTYTGNYLLFLSKSSDEKFSLYTSISEDGVEWSELTPFVSKNLTDRAFLPSHAASLSSKAGDLIVFQGMATINGRKSYQLFSTYSSDGGYTFSHPKQITYDGNFQNERPDIKAISAQNYFIVTWERSKNNSNHVGVASLMIDRAGTPIEPVSEIFDGTGKAINPRALVVNKVPIITWTQENEGRSTLYLYDAELESVDKIRTSNQSMLFARPYNIGNRLEIFWQEGQDVKHLMHISPDNSVQKPKLFYTIEENKQKKLKYLTVRVELPFDSSGIAGYSYKWSKDKAPKKVSKTIQKFPSETVLTFEPEEDGDWYIGVRVQDFAGNWSKVSTVACVFDTTPPLPPDFKPLPLDKNAFCTSNTIRLSWEEPEEDESGNGEYQIHGYTWKIEPVNILPMYKDFKDKMQKEEKGISDEALQEFLKDKVNIKNILPAFSKQKSTHINLNNYDNGIYCLSVAAIDGSGNISQPNVKFFALNKFIAYTIITNIDIKKELGGTFNLSLTGRGFKERGDVDKVFIDKDGLPPYDLTLSKNEFSIISDRFISKIRVDDLQEGRYKIGLSHPSRGVYFSSSYITVDEMGTIKFGNFNYPYKEKIGVNARISSIFNFSFYVRLSLFVLFLVVISLYVIGISKIIKEYKSLKVELYLLLKGDAMAKEQKTKKSKELKTRGLGLRFKLVFFTLMLVISIILLLAVPILSQFTKTQTELMADSLVSKTETVLESLVSNSRAYLQEKNVLEVSGIPNQVKDIDDMIFATITSEHQDGKKIGFDFVWGSSDDDIASYIDTESLLLGQSKLKDYTKDDLNQKLTEINQEATEYVGEASRLVVELTREALNYAYREDEAGKEKRDEIQASIRQTEEHITQKLKDLANSGIGSYPPFDSTALSRSSLEYLFYKPILYRQSNEDDSFVHGIVYLKVSTKNLLDQVEAKQKEITMITLSISLFALFAGILGAWILASVITNPLKKLAVHVAMIRDTEDKEKLSGKSIKIKQKDEVGLLGEIINEMAENLSKSAAAAKDLTVGKEIQKMFIPLDTDSAGRKLISGKRVEENVEFFGYYEGAKGVSGDYFDYVKLDERYYAIIKCDVSGKGVPASLIMVEVATLFSNFFKDWTFKKNGFNMSGIVGQINDAIESRGFKGRFAAFTLCIFDTLTGSAYFCNAGDNIINIYDSREGKMKEIVLKETAAAGVFPTMLVDMKGGFPVEKIDIKKGDILFLYTDGIEESKRMFRNKDLKIITCKEEGLKEGELHETHTVGQDSEEMGKERVQAIIEAVLHHERFSLKKMHNPIENESFEFDFTTCEGTIEEAILALVSVEKIFRLYQDKSATNFDTVIVDKAVDKFLNKHFLQYPNYCLNREPHPEYDEYLYYTNIRQDEQYDDLTILAIKKK